MSCVIKYLYNTIFPKCSQQKHHNSPKWVTCFCAFNICFYFLLLSSYFKKLRGEFTYNLRPVEHNILIFHVDCFIVCSPFHPRFIFHIYPWSNLLMQESHEIVFDPKIFALNPNEIMSRLPLTRNTRFVTTLPRTGGITVTRIWWYFGKESDYWNWPWSLGVTWHKGNMSKTNS